MTTIANDHLFPTFPSLTLISSKGPDRQVQLAITAQKSVSLQFEAAGRHSQVYSKELYLWGQEQPEDIKDGMFIQSNIFLKPHWTRFARCSDVTNLKSHGSIGISELCAWSTQYESRESTGRGPHPLENCSCY